MIEINSVKEYFQYFNYMKMMQLLNNIKPETNKKCNVIDNWILRSVHRYKLGKGKNKLRYKSLPVQNDYYNKYLNVTFKRSFYIDRNRVVKRVMEKRKII